MPRFRILTALVVLLALGEVASAQIPPLPTEWYLTQNAPDPFCSNEGGGGTTIEFGMPRAAHVRMRVLFEASEITYLVRTLIDMSMSAGIYRVVWDGLAEDGTAVGNGAYLYRLTATDETGGGTLFEDTKVVHVFCTTSATSATWKTVKALYRE